MNINELKQERASKINEMDALNKVAVEAKRSMNDEEVTNWESLRGEIEDLDKQIERAETMENLNKSIVEREIKEDKNEIEMKENKRSLVDYIEESLRGEKPENFTINSEEIRSFTTATAEGAIATEVLDLSIIGKRPIWKEMGVRHMGGLTGAFKLPYKKPTVAGKKGEGVDSDVNGESLGHIDFSIKAYPMQDTISKELLASGNENVLAGIIADLIESTERAVTADVYTQALATAQEVSGATSITRSNMNKLKANVDSDGNFLMTRDDFYVGADVKVDAGSGKFLTEYVSNEKGKLSDGTPLFYSSLFNGSEIVYGDLSNIVVGEWGYDIEWDTVTRAKQREVIITVNKLANVANRNPYAFAKTKLA
ncbi:phage major capsid protein [Labilibacter sediminis]|nr:phage major capsid protein [Labilibacter sediminis]